MPQEQDGETPTKEQLHSTAPPTGACMRKPKKVLGGERKLTDSVKCTSSVRCLYVTKDKQ